MKVLIATGGSGGHIFPALETALELRGRGHSIEFAGALAMAREKILDLGFPCHQIDARGLNDKSVSGVMGFMGGMFKAYVLAKQMIKEVKPDKVLGFGGYGSFAVIAAANRLNVPSMIHEQNVVPGKANAVLARFVKRIAISFKESVRYFDANKTVWTGCPCHNQPSQKSKSEIYGLYGLDSQRKTIVLLGGSQGSQRLNEDFFKCMKQLAPEGNYQAIHMTGKNEYASYLNQYAEIQLPVAVRSFISPIEDVYAIADVIITRSGAATVSEIAAFGIPAVFIPYPFAGGHQKYNAEVLTNKEVAVVIDQAKLNAGVLKEAVLNLVRRHLSREQVRNKTKDLFLDRPAEQLAKALEQC